VPEQCPNGCGPLEPYAEADIGVGTQQFGPWGCPVCHWIEPTPEEYAEMLGSWCLHCQSQSCVRPHVLSMDDLPLIPEENRFAFAAGLAELLVP
jgi:hypothetical protein